LGSKEEIIKVKKCVVGIHITFEWAKDSTISICHASHEIKFLQKYCKNE
jgi:hypothetical protein